MKYGKMLVHNAYLVMAGVFPFPVNLCVAKTPILQVSV